MKNTVRELVSRAFHTDEVIRVGFPSIFDFELIALFDEYGQEALAWTGYHIYLNRYYEISVRAIEVIEDYIADLFIGDSFVSDAVVILFDLAKHSHVEIRYFSVQSLFNILPLHKRIDLLQQICKDETDPTNLEMMQAELEIAP